MPSVDVRVMRTLFKLQDNQAVDLVDYEAGSMTILRKGFGCYDIEYWAEDFAELNRVERNIGITKVEKEVADWFGLIDQLDQLESL